MTSKFCFNSLHSKELTIANKQNLSKAKEQIVSRNLFQALAHEWLWIRKQTSLMSCGNKACAMLKINVVLYFHKMSPQILLAKAQ